ncbi:MAG: SDR family oxidoreductase [Cytophagales bacterium]|nr:MAG: SDR family oxidoreductase [Cytophagales bacterium]
MNTILILGATSEIGKEIAYEFARHGFGVVLAGRQPAKLTPLQADLQIKHQIGVEVVEFDALDFSSHPSFYANLVSKPSVVACVFGYLGSQEKAQNDFAEAEKIIHSNYTGAVSILNIIAGDFEQKKAGTIICISSVAGERGRQSNYFYGSAKAAFSVYADGLRNRLFKANVHVMTVKPGFVRTKMTEGLALPPMLTAMPAQVGKAVFNAYLSKTNTLYVLWFWKYIMLIIKNIPESIFKKLKL